MRLNKFTAAVGFTALMSTMSASAALIEYTAGPGLGLAITDDGYDGSLASMAASTIDVADAGDINSLTVEVSMEHTWIGDLVMKLESAQGDVITLMSRPGMSESADDGTGCCGTSTNFDFSPVIFDDTALTAAEDAGSGGGTYVPNDFLSTFSGQSMTGTWTLYIGDSAEADVGSLDYWSLSIDYTADNGAPENTVNASAPLTASLLGLGLAGIGLSRRKRKN
ncbi:MAG: proprotein convertase P-domain-containing protein [Pseudomonadota bacterium]|nr:proprotein convertase P-domain-containing protein [Pseudomonadota bacterium]